MSRKTRKLMWSVPLIAAVAVIGALAALMTLAPGGVLAQDAQLGPPRDLEAMADGQTMVKLSWRAPASGTAVDYRIDRAADADGSVWEEVDLSTGITILGDIGRFTDEGRKAGTTYHYRVFAIDDNNDEGEPAEPVSATTDPATRPAAPKSLTLATAPTDHTAAGQLTLEWTPPDVTGGSAITSYRIESSATGTGGWSTLKEINIPDLDLLPDGVATDEAITGYTYTDKSLMASTTRHYRVFAINKVGTSDPSSKVMGTTADGNTPAAPTLPQVQGTDGQIILRWIAPNPAASGSELTGAPVTGYKIERKKTAGAATDDDPWVTVVANTRSAGTNYRAGGAIHTAEVLNDDGTVATAALRWRYQITPINSVGAGAVLAVADTAGVTAPNASEYGQVGSLTARAVSRTEINLSWAVPAKGGVSGTTSYNVFASKDGGTTWTVSDADTPITITGTTAEHTGLKAGERWTYLVFATTNGNMHRESRMVSATTSPATPPGAPMVAATTPSAGQINLTITAPTDNGGKSVTGYMIERSENQVSWETVVANFVGDEILSTETIEYYDKKLPAGTTFYYRVRAINSAGAGDPVLTGAVSTPGSLSLGAPQGLVGVPKAGHNVDLYWLTPGDADGAPITGYWIELSEDNGANWSSVMSDTESRATTYTHERAPAGKSLLYRVQAINSVGPGPASAVEEVMTAAMTAPDAPEVEAMADSATQITVSWTEPYNGGSEITGYVLQKMMGMDYMTIAATDASTWWETLNCQQMIDAVADTRSDEPAEDPMMDAFCKHYPGTPKASSEATTLSDASKMVVDSTFMANYDTITGTSYVDMGLTANTPYSYRVAAMNAIGKGDYGMAMATTAEMMPREAAPPTGVMVSQLLNSITVTWTPNSAQNTGTIKAVLYAENLMSLAAGVAEPVKSFNLAAGDPGTHTFNGVPAGTYRVGVAVVDDEGMHKVHLVSEPVMITAGQ